MSVPSNPVVVVGAGLSGLFAAYVLAEAGVHVVVVEAQDRVGGRTLTQTPDGQPVDQGAGYVGSTQYAVKALLKRFGILTNDVPGKEEGEYTFSLGGEVLHSKLVLDDLLKFLTPLELMLVGIAILETYVKGWTIPLDSPWDAESAKEWDAMTVETWINQRFYPRGDNDFENARQIWRFICRTPLGIEAHETSYLYFLWYMKSGGGFFRFLFGAQDQTVVGGTMQIAENLQLAIEQTDPSSKVKLSQRAMKVQQMDDHVLVTTSNEMIKGDRCIVSTTPHVRNQIVNDPLLPPVYSHLSQRSPMGTTIKVHLFYEEKFWIEDGFNGNATIFDGPSLSQVYDVTEPAGGKPCLQGFYVGQVGRDVAKLDKAAREKDAKDELARVFENEKAKNPLMYEEYIWDSHTFIGGAPVGTCAPGTLTNFGKALRTNSGKVHFAGTETSLNWAGYMDGAIRAGHRVAVEILNEYGLPDPEKSFPEAKPYATPDELEKIMDLACFGAKAWYKTIDTENIQPMIPSNKGVILDYLIKQGFDNTDDWLAKYIATHEEDVAALCVGIAKTENNKLLV